MYLDLLLLILILSFAVVGFVQGFIHQMLSIAVLLAILFASEPISLWLQRSDTSWAKNLPHFALWCAVSFSFLIFGWLIRFGVRRKLNNGPLRATDRWIGSGLGLVKGIVIAFILSLALQVMPRSIRQDLVNMDKDFNESRFIAASSSVLDWQRFQGISKLRSLKQKWEQLQSPQKSSRLAESPWDWASDTDAE